MATYTLTVNVDSADLVPLKEAGYKLCIAKRVNDKYDVVWSGSDFFKRNTFQWNVAFQVFGSQKFEGGLRVGSDTEERAIDFGEICTLDKYGSMHPAHGAKDTSGVLRVENQYGAMHLGVNAKLGTKWSAIYLSDKPFYTGEIKLTPIEKVVIWFDSKSETGTMLVDAITDCIELDFTGSAEPQSVRYASDPKTPGKGGWARGEQFILSSTYHIDTDTFSFEPPSAPLIAKLTDIINSQKDRQPSTLSLSALTEFHEQGAAQTFAQYALDHQPDGIRTWEFTHSGHIVESKLKAQEDQDDDLAVRFLQDAYLSVLYSFQGPKYKRLSFDVHGRSSSPTPYWGESSGELVIRYGNVTDAANAAVGIPLLAKTGQSIYIANVHDENDEWVRMRLGLINPSGDVAQDRQTIVNPLAAALFGGKLFFEHPPLFPNAQDRVLGLVKWDAN